MSEWALTTLGQEVELLTGYPFKSAQYTDNEDDILLLRGDNIGQGYLRWENAKKWSTEKTEGIEDYFLREGDVVLAMDRPWIEAGLKFAYLSQYDLPCLLVQRVSRLRAKEKLNQTFLRYVIQGYEFTQYIIKTQTGTAVPHISGTQIKDFEFPSPPLDEQKEIAKTLGVLDRKISNLRKQNETLEQIAQTLFKHWFVDFEFPNEAGEPYKSSGGEMARSELGEIPAGWRIGTLKECLEHLIDNRGKTPEFFDSGVPALSAKFVKGGDLVNRDSFNYVSHDLFEQSEKLRIGDVILTSEAPLGETYFIAKETRYYPAQRVFALRANKSIISCSYLNYWLSSPIGQFFLKRRGSGSTVQGIKQSELYQCEVIVPDRKIQDRVSEAFTKILNKKELNSDQIQTLTKTRDVLLPQLMSGKLRITAEVS